MKRMLFVSFLIVSILFVGVITSSMIGIHITTRNQLADEESKIIIVGTTDGVESSLDMAEAYDFFGWNIIACLSSGLVEVEPGSIAGNEDILPALATSWNASSGGDVWDFNLRQGVVFENGNPFNSSVVKYTFDRNCDLEGDGLLIEVGPQLNVGYTDIIDNVTILDIYKVRFYLKMPFAPFLQLLSIPPSFMVDPLYAPKDTLISYIEGNARASHPCGLGPFILGNWSRVGYTDIELKLIANPDYWDAPLDELKVDEIIIKFYPTYTQLAAAKVAHDIDIAFRTLTATQIDDLNQSTDFKVFEELSPQIQYLCFQQRIYPFNETLVRQAIGAALNRIVLCDVVFLNQKSPLLSIIPSNLEYHLPSFGIFGESNYSFTIATLDLFGYNVTNKLMIDLYYESSGHYPQSQEQAIVYQTELEASGVIDVTLHSLDWPSYRLARNEGIMPVFMYGWYNDYPDADDYAFLPFASWLNLGYNQTYPQGGVDQYNLWVEGRSAMTDEARRSAYYELQNLQAQECSVIPLWQGKQFVVTDHEISGVYLDITGLLRYWLLNTTEIIITTTTTTTTSTTATTTTTTTPTSSSTTTLTTNTSGFEIPVEIVTLMIAISSAAVIVIIVIVIIRSRGN